MKNKRWIIVLTVCMVLLAAIIGAAARSNGVKTGDKEENKTKSRQESGNIGETEGYEYAHNTWFPSPEGMDFAD